VIEWPPPAIRWWKWANQAKFPIHAILEDSALHQAMRDWNECILSWTQFAMLPSKWREALLQWRGISDRSDGKGYVGSAAEGVMTGLSGANAVRTQNPCRSAYRESFVRRFKCAVACTASTRSPPAAMACSSAT
jgi:hypothetical protein